MCKIGIGELQPHRQETKLHVIHVAGRMCGDGVCLVDEVGCRGVEKPSAQGKCLKQSVSRVRGVGRSPPHLSEIRINLVPTSRHYPCFLPEGSVGTL